MRRCGECIQRSSGSLSAARYRQASFGLRPGWKFPTRPCFANLGEWLFAPALQRVCRVRGWPPVLAGNRWLGKDNYLLLFINHRLSQRNGKSEHRSAAWKFRDCRSIRGNQWDQSTRERLARTPGFSEPANQFALQVEYADNRLGTQLRSVRS